MKPPHDPNADYHTTADKVLFWSSYNSFLYSKESWYKSYILREKSEQASGPYIDFGKKLANSIEDGTCSIPLLMNALAPKKEYRFDVMFGDIHLKGSADAFEPKSCRVLHEIKSGLVTSPWTQKRVDEHGQLTWYVLCNFLQNKVPPEEVKISLFWLPTEMGNDFLLHFADNFRVHRFDTTRDIASILRLGADIQRVWGEMKEYIAARQGGAVIPLSKPVESVENSS